MFPKNNKVLPNEVRFSYDFCQILADMNSFLQPDYAALLGQFPYADGLRDTSICQSSSPTDAENLIESVKRGKFSTIIIGWLIFIINFVNAARKKGMAPVEYADWIYDQCKKLNREMGYRAAWIEAYGEIGNSVTWPLGKTFTKKEAQAYFRNWFKDGRSLTQHWGSVSPAETLTFFKHAKRHDENFRNLPIYYCDATLFAIHEAFRYGFPLVVYEGGAGQRDSLQTGIAFTRGGAKMFDAFWGIDLSPWGGVSASGFTQTNNAGAWFQGMTPDTFHRLWITSYMSGCNTFLHEVGYCFFYTETEGRGKLLSDFGYRAMNFYRLTRETLADRGIPLVPFAVMLEEESGYRGNSCREFNEKGELLGLPYDDTPDQRLQIWSGKLARLTKGDWQVHRTISAIWSLPDNLWKQFAGKWPDEKIRDLDSFKPNFHQMVQVGEIDPRDFGMFLRDSSWADCFDVIPEDSPQKALNQYYKTILLAGDIQTDNGLWERLGRFVENGGNVILTVEQLDASARASFGIPPETKTENINVRWMLAGGKRLAITEEILLYDISSPEKTLKVWASDEKTGKPIIMESVLGKGRIYLLLCAYGMDKDGQKLSNICTNLIDLLYAESVGIFKKGPPCQMMINRRENDTLVTLLNHTGKDWKGEITFIRKNYPVVEEVREVIQDLDFPENLVHCDPSTVSVRVRVPAYETKILSFGPKRQTRPFKGVLTTTTGMTEDDRNFLDEIKKKGPLEILGKGYNLKPDSQQ